MIDGYGLEYADYYLKNNIKLSTKAVNEVKMLLFKEMVDNLCRLYIEAKCDYKKNIQLILSNKMNKLKDMKSFYKYNNSYGYKSNFIQEILMFKYTLSNPIEEDYSCDED